jgi:hypothetical protein
MHQAHRTSSTLCLNFRLHPSLPTLKVPPSAAPAICTAGQSVVVQPGAVTVFVSYASTTGTDVLAPSSAAVGRREPLCVDAVESEEQGATESATTVGVLGIMGSGDRVSAVLSRFPISKMLVRGMAGIRRATLMAREMSVSRMRSEMSILESVWPEVDTFALLVTGDSGMW